MLESAFSLHDRAFAENLGTVLLYAVVGTVINILTIGSSLYACSMVGAFSDLRLGLITCLVFSSLIAAVDPVAVLANISRAVGSTTRFTFSSLERVSLTMQAEHGCSGGATGGIRHGVSVIPTGGAVPSIWYHKHNNVRPGTSSVRGTQHFVQVPHNHQVLWKNAQVIDHSMAGVEEIIGQRGSYFIREIAAHYDHKYLKRWLQRECETKDAHIMAIYDKIALQ
ncbi:PREDICTED: uncharacterized protein LOC106812759 [Priapulus caudatus]|uniref:Uncharacterized protein LOC106812759 n=1 Tax=Priapulus caudatus TaxID=37621 RepID=A0ABM1EJ45_PRICU|nr:PREDICTED: uncharacterized protein LOC106812759 [Priapulus caudatus]